VRADEAWTGTELVSWLLRCNPFRSRPLKSTVEEHESPPASYLFCAFSGRQSHSGHSTFPPEVEETRALGEPIARRRIEAREDADAVARLFRSLVCSPNCAVRNTD
jgi:hypothetical protein